MRRSATLLFFPLLLAGCATGNPGWTGPGTESFDQAMADCKGRTAALGGKPERKFAIDTCMAGKGWTPPER